MAELKKWHKVLIFFLLSYLATFLIDVFLNLDKGILGVWSRNPTYVLFPVLGFFLVYLSIPYFNEYFKTKFFQHPAFGFLFFILGIFAFWIVLVVFVQNNFTLSGQNPLEALKSSIDYVGPIFWEQFFSQAYLVFLLSGTIAAFSRIAVER